MNILLLLSCAFSLGTWAAEPISLLIRSEISTSPNPLTSERVSVLDPLEQNPAFVRYFLERKVRLDGLSSETPTLVSEVTIHLRPKGNLFKEIQDFPCELTKPDLRFATRDGVIRVAHEGTEIWSKILKENITTLTKKLNSSSDRRIMTGFQKWLEDMEKTYWKRFESKKAQIEFDDYQKQGKVICKKGGLDLLSWDQLLEKSPTEEYLDPFLLTRAPAQRVWGRFTVRGSMRLGTRELNGRFLIDPSADGNALSTEWLKAQGVDLRPIYSGKKIIKRVHFDKGPKGKKTTDQVLGPTLVFEDFGFGGKFLGPIEFVLGETEVFFQPKAELDCCDGVLGIPFLRQFVVEFSAHSFSSVGFYRPEEFPHPKDAVMKPLWFSDRRSLFEIAEKIQMSEQEVNWIDRMHSRLFSRQSKPVVTPQ